MRISEKTVEINFCKGLPSIIGKSIFWFGLTQKQEAQAGFDVCTKLSGTLVLFQIKASRVILKNGARRFQAPHDQMQTLRNQVKSNRKIFYVFPSAGTTIEVCSPDCFSHCSQLLDVSFLPSKIPLPLAKGKTTPRARGVHYVDVTPGLAKIHSEPFRIKLIPVAQLASIAEELSFIPANNHAQHEFDTFWEAISSISRESLYGAVIT